MKEFLQENEYVDYNSEIIQKKVAELFSTDMNETEKAKIAYEFVRDEIPHSFDCNTDIITAKASDVLKYKTGICHGKGKSFGGTIKVTGNTNGLLFSAYNTFEW